MTKLEQVPPYPNKMSQTIWRDKALEAATIDLREAEERGYARGVEDMRSLEILRIAHDEMQKACFEVLLSKFPRSKQFVKDRRKRKALLHMKAAISLMDKAFHGAHNIARVIIRQRLARIGKGNGNG